MTITTSTGLTGSASSSHLESRTACVKGLRSRDHSSSTAITGAVNMLSLTSIPAKQNNAARVCHTRRRNTSVAVTAMKCRMSTARKNIVTIEVNRCTM